MHSRAAHWGTGRLRQQWCGICHGAAVRFNKHLITTPLSRIPWVGSWWARVGTIPFVGGVLAVVAIVAVGVVFATGGGGGKGDPVVTSVQCAPGQSLVVLQAGQTDNFSSSPDAPPAAPSAGLMMRLAPPISGFDGTAVDRRFGHTFSSLPPSVVSGEVLVRLRPLPTSIKPASENDTVELSFTDAAGNLQTGGWVRFIGSGNSAAGLAASQWIPANWQSGYTFTFNVAALPNASGPATDEIPLLNSRGFLDIVVQDDTAVDYITLSLCVASPTPAPFPTPIIVGGLDRDTPTPTLTPTSTPFVIGGGLTPIPVATDTPVPTPTAVPAATATPAPTITATLTPRPTNTPALTPTPTSTCGPPGTAGACTPTPTPTPR